MRRPLIPLSAAFALGVCFARWGAWEARLFLAPLFVLAMVMPFIRKRKISLALLITGFLFLGALAEAESRNLPANSIIFFQSTSRVSVTGKVDSLPEITRNGRRETVSFVLSSSGLQSGDFLRVVQGKVQVFLMNLSSADFTPFLLPLGGEGQDEGEIAALPPHPNPLPQRGEGKFAELKL